MTRFLILDLPGEGDDAGQCAAIALHTIEGVSLFRDDKSEAWEVSLVGKTHADGAQETVPVIGLATREEATEVFDSLLLALEEGVGNHRIAVRSGSAVDANIARERRAEEFGH